MQHFNPKEYEGAEICARVKHALWALLEIP